MKQVLGIGILLLGVMFALNAGAALPPAPVSGQPEDGSASVLIYSTAQWHKAERYGVRRTPIAIIVNGQFRSGPLDVPGLRAIAINREKAGAVHSFDVANSEAEIGRFADFCADATPGTVLALGLYRIASPESDGSGTAWERLDQLYRELGAQKPPTQTPGASWAYMCVRDEGSWRPLAEAHSLIRGVKLARTLGPDPLGTIGAGSVFTDRWNSISLIDRFEQASYVTEGFTHVRRPDSSVSGSSLDAIFAHPPYGEEAKALGYPENRIVWDDFMVPAGAVFRCQLGLSSRARERSNGVVFQIFVDGEPLATREHGVQPFSPDSWSPWSVDLSSLEGRVVRFELRVGSNGDLNSDHALWGDPVIQHRVEPSSSP